MKIRQATASDVPAIIEVGRQTWPSTYAFAGPSYIAEGLATWWSTEAITRSLTATTVLVAVDDEGAVTGTGNIDLRGETAIIWKLYVLPSAQGLGVGSRLIRALLNVAGDRPVRLEYTDGNERAAAFYASHGFVEVAREPQPDSPARIWLERPAGR